MKSIPTSALVQCINGTMGLGVKYWSIGNEPDLKYSGFDAADVAEYVRRFSRAMKEADPTIKIVAPETSWFQWTNFLDPLTNGGANDITGRDNSTSPWWVDVISFHAYPYGNSFPDRNGVISATTGISNNLQTLKNRIAQRNTALGRTGDNALTIAITETNINFDNPSNDNIDGVGGVSFLGGQFWADLLGVAMQHGVDFVNFWSVIEGGNVAQDKGYLCNKPAELGHEWAHPSYHHFKMMAEHFRGNALLPVAPATQFDNQTNVKTYAAKDTDQVAVILINQDGATDFSYAVSLNGSASGGTLQVNIPANISATQSTGTLYKQSTILLVFNSSGVLQKKVEYRRFGPSGTPWLNTTP
jgi:alpha-L-arabinofuranosidase